MPKDLKFNDGYAEAFAFAIPTCFKDSLARRTFSVGDVFYDNRAAYELIWREALKAIDAC